MKVLILSITAGEGHNSTAKAVKAQFDTMPEVEECRILDTYAYLNKPLATVISQGYLLSTGMLPKPYAKFYRLAEKRRKTAEDKTATRISNGILAEKLKKYTDEYRPDIVISTHIFAAAIVDIMKEKYADCNFIAAGIVTDFCFHPFWEEAVHNDYIITANELMNIRALKKGFRKQQILPLGIPIKPIFSSRKDKTEMREKHGLDPDKFTVLLMSGSMGYGSIETTVRMLDKINVDFQTVVVCGNNTKAKETLDALHYRKKFVILGYVDYVDELMDASDCIISKPGGLTTSEALAKNLPMIIVNPIPGQEDRNTEFLLNNGCAMYVTKTSPLDEVLYQFFHYPEKIDNMKKNISLIAKPNATKDICEFLCEKCKSQNEIIKF